MVDSRPTTDTKVHYFSSPIVGPSYPVSFLRIQLIVDFVVHCNLHGVGVVSGPAQFKLLFFKGQLYFENGATILFVPKLLKERGMLMPSGKTFLSPGRGFL